MVIQFVCPNGHPLSASEEQAGKPGKCPKCQSSFVVPVPKTSATAAPAKPAPSASGGNGIAFLCPNGHKLTGARSMEGKAGQCPHCGAKFRIPGHDQAEKPAHRPRFKISDEDEIPVGEIIEHPEKAEVANVVQEVAAAEPAIEEKPPEELDLIELEPEPSEPPPAGSIHPLADICWRLCRPGHGPIELTCADGQTLTAQFFSGELSRKEYGVFACANDSGDFTITAVPWDAIRRLDVSLPKLTRALVH
jgi:hypothetical protein